MLRSVLAMVLLCAGLVAGESAGAALRLVPPPGTYRVAVPVVPLARVSAGERLVYTVDGSTPTAASWPVRTAILLSDTTTLRVATVSSQGVVTREVSGLYTIAGTLTTARPIATPPGGTYPVAQIVTLSCPTAGAAIRYTLDGSQPTTSSALYAGPLTISASAVLQARAFGGELAVRIGRITVRVPAVFPSGVCTASYVIESLPQVAAPVVLPASGIYLSELSATATTTTPGAELRYRLDAADPAATDPLLPADGLAIDRSATIRVRAFRSGWTPSTVTAAAYELQAATPAASLPAGVHLGEQAVSLASTTAGTTIRYTLDGTTPTVASLAVAGPIALPGSCILTAIASRTGWSDSPALVVAYALQVPPPSLAPPAGTYSTPPSIAATGMGVIRYTLDGSVPTATSPIIPADLVLERSTKVAIAAFRDGWMPSPEVAAAYTLTVTQPTISPAGGVFTTPVTVTLACSTPGADIRYTLDGSASTATSPLYTAPLQLSQSATVRAIATRAGWTDSAEATTTYTIDLPRVATIALAPATASVPAGGTATFSADIRDQFGAPIVPTQPLSWSVTPDGAGTIVDGTLVVTSNARGVVAVTASADGISDSATVTILPNDEEFADAVAPTVTVAITGGLTGDVTGTDDVGPISYSNAASISATVTVSVASGNSLQAVQVEAGGTLISLGASAGTAQIVLPEGTYTVTAAATVRGLGGSSASGSSTGVRVLVDRTVPRIAMLVRSSGTGDIPLDTVAYEGVLALGANTSTATTARSTFGLSCFGVDDLTLIADVIDSSGLTVRPVAAPRAQAGPAALTMSRDVQDSQRLLISGFNAVAESATVDPVSLILSGPGVQPCTIHVTDRCGNLGLISPVKFWKKTTAPAPAHYASLELVKTGFPDTVHLHQDGRTQLAPVRFVATSADVIGLLTTQVASRVTAGPASFDALIGAGPVMWALPFAIEDTKTVQVNQTDASGNLRVSTTPPVDWIASQFVYPSDAGTTPPEGIIDPILPFETYAIPHVREPSDPGTIQFVRHGGNNDLVLVYPRMTTGFSRIAQDLTDQPVAQQFLRFEWEGDASQVVGSSIGNPPGAYFLRSKGTPLLAVGRSIFPPRDPYGRSSYPYTSTIVYRADSYPYNAPPTDDKTGLLSWSPMNIGPARTIAASWATDRTVTAPHEVSRRAPVSMRISGSATDLPAPQPSGGGTNPMLSIPRDVPGGWAQVQWREQSQSANSPSALPMNLSGFRGVNLVKLLTEVILTGQTSELVVQGYFGIANPSLGSVRFIDAQRAGVWAEICAGGGQAAEVAEAILAEIQAIPAPPWSREQRDRMLVLRRDISRLVPLVYTGPLADLKTYLESRATTISSSNIWRQSVAAALARIPQAQIDEAAAAQATDVSTDALLRESIVRQATAAVSRIQAAQLLVLGVAEYRSTGQRMLDEIAQQYDPQLAAINEQLAAINADLDAQVQAILTAPWQVIYPPFSEVNSSVWRQITIPPLKQALEAQRTQLMTARQAAIDASPGPGILAAARVLPQIVVLPNSVSLCSAAADRTQTGSDPANDYFIGMSSIRLNRGGLAGPMREQLSISVNPGPMASGLYHVDVHCGGVHAYTDELSQQYAGANGAHRMKEALKIISIEYVTPDKNGNLKPVKFIQESNPSPKVEINSMSPGDVSFNSAYQTATFTVSGKITDEVAQITGDGSGDIQTAAVYAEGKKLADVTLNKVQDAVSLLKPYAHHYEFSQQITVDMKNSMYCSVEVVTSENKLHQTGRSAVLLTQTITPVDSASSGGGSSVVYSIALNSVPSPSVVETLSFVPPGSIQPVELIESDVASLRFSDQVTGWEVDLLGTLSLSDTAVDSLKVKLTNSQSGSVVYGTMQETGVSTNVFMLAIPVIDNGSGDDDAKYTATFADVTVQPERSADGAYAPYLFRLKGPGVEDLKISVDGRTYTLTEKDGYYYLSGSPIKVFILGKGNIWLLDGAVKSGDLVKVFTMDGWPNAHFGRPSSDGTGIVISQVETLNLDPDRAYGGTEQEISLSIAGRKWVDGDTFDMIGQQNTQAVQLSADKTTMTGTFQLVEPAVNSHTKASINVTMSGVPSTLPEVFFLNNRADTGVWQGSVPDSILPYLVRRDFKAGDIANWRDNNFKGQAALWGHALTWDELAFLDQTKQREDVPPWVLIADLTQKERDAANDIFASMSVADDRLEAYANFKSRQRIILYAALLKSGGQILDIYRVCRDVNPLHFAWERGWQIGGGQEQFTRVHVSRTWAAAEMVAALAIIKATDVGIAKLKSSIEGEAIAYVPRREVLSIKIDPGIPYPKTSYSFEITPEILAARNADGTFVVTQGRYLWVRNANGRFFISKRYTPDFPNTGNGNGGISHPQVMGGEVPVTGAGELTIQNGVIREFTNQSGHYKPSVLQMMDCVAEMWKGGFKFGCKPGTVGMVGYKVWNGRVVK